MEDRAGCPGPDGEPGAWGPEGRHSAVTDSTAAHARRAHTDVPIIYPEAGYLGPSVSVLRF